MYYIQTAGIANPWEYFALMDLVECLRFFWPLLGIVLQAWLYWWQKVSIITVFGVGSPTKCVECRTFTVAGVRLAGHSWDCTGSRNVTVSSKARTENLNYYPFQFSLNRPELVNFWAMKHAGDSVTLKAFETTFFCFCESFCTVQWWKAYEETEDVGVSARNNVLNNIQSK